MQLKDLHTFSRIAEFGNLHTAAEAIGTTQPALSKVIRRLEVSLGVRLFERTSRGVALTEFGRLLLERGRTLQQVADDVRTEITDMKVGHSGQLRLGVVPAVVDAAVVPTLVRLLRMGDPVRFLVTVQLTATLIRDLQAGSLDFALGTISEEIPDGLACLPLWEQQSYVVARKGHWMQHRPFTLSDLAAQTWLLPPKHIILRTWVDSMFSAGGIAPPTVFLEVDSSPAAFASLVRKSDVLTAMTADTLTSPMGANLAPLGPPAGRWSTRIGLYWRRSAYFSRLMERCRDCLVTAIDSGRRSITA